MLDRENGKEERKGAQDILANDHTAQPSTEYPALSHGHITHMSAVRAVAVCSLIFLKILGSPHGYCSISEVNA